MALLILWLFLQDSAVLSEDFDREPPRDTVYPGWERVSDAAHPIYNPIVLRDGAVVLGTLGGATAFRHRGVAVDPRLSYRLTAAATPGLEGRRENRAWVSLRWLDGDGRELREDAGTAAELSVETPPAEAATVQVALHFGGPDVRGEARFDSVRLVARPRVEVRPVGRSLPVFAENERIALRISVPALEGAAIRARLLDADGSPLRDMAGSDDGTLATAALPPAAYRLAVTASRAGTPDVMRESWVLVRGQPLFDPPDPSFGLRLGDPHAEAAALCDVAGARHVAVVLPEGADQVAALARRPNTSITGIFAGRADRELARRLHPYVDRWVGAADREIFGDDPVDPAIEVVFAGGAEEALRRGVEAAGRRVYFDASSGLPVLFAVRALNDLVGGARKVDAPSWAPASQAFEKQGRKIVAVAGAEVKPPAGWSLIDPLLGRREIGDSVKAGTRTVFLVSEK